METKYQTLTVTRPQTDNGIMTHSITLDSNFDRVEGVAFIENSGQGDNYRIGVFDESENYLDLVNKKLVTIGENPVAMKDRFFETNIPIYADRKIDIKTKITTTLNEGISIDVVFKLVKDKK